MLFYVFVGFAKVSLAANTLCLFRVFKNLLIYLFIYLENKKTASAMKIEEIFISSFSLLMLFLYTRVCTHTYCVCSDNGSKDFIPIPDSSQGAVI